jgi:DNA invertase Pin-like site-specific DNA recombinase
MASGLTQRRNAETMSSKRTFQPHKATKGEHVHSEQLLTNEPVAVYYRQSTNAQVGNISTAIQTIDMVDELEHRGWERNNIILIDADEGVSGTKRIDEREGMSELFELITEHKIGAVACQDEDRLFRDMTQIQVNIFVDVCRKANVKVITPFFVYDFAHPLH